jgi:sugar lactone lactonase YvrE
MPKWNNPRGVAVDGAGNLYIADTSNFRIREVAAATGVITTVAGNGTSAYSGDGGAATSAELQYPSGVAVDSAGNLYIADTSNFRIREMSAGTGIITTVAGDGTAGYSGDGGPATSAELYSPEGVAVDAAGDIYINDSSNGRIREVSAGTGIITTVAGDGTAGYSGDGGAATSAELNYPSGVAVDGAGDIYIADSSNSRIREVSAGTGIITTIAGNGTAAYNGDVRAATSPELNYPDGVAIDGAGNLYIADTYNSVIAEVQVTTPPTLTFATLTPIGSIDTTDGPQTVSVSNIGNAPLTFTTPPTGSNPSYSANFPLNSSDTNLCSSSAQLLEGTSCDVSANFDPTGPATNTGSITLTDNALNLTTSSVGSAQQSISLSGMASSVTATTAISSVALTQNHPPAAPFTPVTGTGGTGSLTYSISPALPAGLSFFFHQRRDYRHADGHQSVHDLHGDGYRQHQCDGDSHLQPDGEQRGDGDSSRCLGNADAGPCRDGIRPSDGRGRNGGANLQHLSGAACRSEPLFHQRHDHGHADGRPRGHDVYRNGDGYQWSHGDSHLQPDGEQHGDGNHSHRLKDADGKLRRGGHAGDRRGRNGGAELQHLSGSACGSQLLFHQRHDHGNADGHHCGHDLCGYVDGFKWSHGDSHLQPVGEQRGDGNHSHRLEDADRKLRRGVHAGDRHGRHRDPDLQHLACAAYGSELLFH